ncbi:hypothetical protein G1K57_12150 [Tenacibaculum finnmarkense]|uniref:hypothetical protein n=1 Tax=Tenacibaculum finnmarkense TaxID=2781243 RepID=UPI001EFC2BC4|nr:hypothetical protein [Tenacibaculum finnmarkense]MCG8808892.1 hypothetical protein [Tenacibaculum finnmarkense]MCG8819127.1 hypothetical protein [Tenacibaculum finnmarkense]
MKRKQIKISVVIIGILILSNFLSGYINIFTEGLFRTYLYQTENANFEFNTMPAKGRDIGMMERQFSHFKKTHSEFQELELHRTFKRNPLKFWNWYSYLTHEMYDYEYQDEVESKTGKGKFGI